MALAAPGCGGADPPGGEGGAGGGDGGTGAIDAGGDAGSPTETIRVVTWNVHDFFDSVKDGTEVVLSSADFQKKVAAVGGVLARFDADVVVLQEVESLRVLDALADGPLAGKGYGARVVSSGNDPRGINVAALSRRPFARVVAHKDDFFTKAGTTDPRYRYARDCLELHVDAAGLDLTLLGVHFKSKSSPDDPDKRAAEAQHTRAIADGLRDNFPTARVLVLGDFNDVPASVPVEAITAGPKGPPFVDVAASLPKGDAWSYEYGGQLQLIDHQVAAPDLAAALVPGSVQIPHDGAVFDASDHAPVVAAFTLSR